MRVNSVQDRYTDGDLLRMLQIMVSDFNKIPTQREILADDRLPTHHTYRNRFGTLANALALAGLGDVPKAVPTTHDTIKEYILDSGMELVGEWVEVGSIITDFEVRGRDGNTAIIDIVDIGQHVSPDVYQGIVRMRTAIADAYSGDREYALVPNAFEAIRHIESIA